MRVLWQWTFLTIELATFIKRLVENARACPFASLARGNHGRLRGAGSNEPPLEGLCSSTSSTSFDNAVAPVR